jgi:hypothetical protein
VVNLIPAAERIVLPLQQVNPEELIHQATVSHVPQMYHHIMKEVRATAVILQKEEVAAVTAVLLTVRLQDRARNHRIQDHLQVLRAITAAGAVSLQAVLIHQVAAAVVPLHIHRVQVQAAAILPQVRVRVVEVQVQEDLIHLQEEGKDLNA